MAVEDESMTTGKVVRRFGLFLVIVAVCLFIAHVTHLREFLNVETIASFSTQIGPWGIALIVAAGAITPLFFCPRWPIAFIGGLLYGVVGGTLLATFASTIGAVLHFLLSRTLLAPMSMKILKRYDLEHLSVPRDREFMAIFLLRAFPLSSFVVTNLLAGVLRMHLGRYVIASFLGMIPSSLMYAAGGKLMKKPDSHFYWIAVLIVVLMVAGTIAAHRWLHPLIKRSREKE